MQRQGSLLSFFKKPSQRSEDGSGGSSSYVDMLRAHPLAQLRKQQPHNPQEQQHNNSSMAEILSNEPLLLDVIGTDTPPEKVPRPIFSSRFLTDRGDENAARPVSSILHKFVKEERKVISEICQKGSQDDLYSSSCNPESAEIQIVGDQGVLKQQTPSRDPSKVSNSKFINNHDLWDYSHFELIPDILGPETPATRPLIPRLKRAKEEHTDIPDKHDAALFEPSKRMKSIQESTPGKKNLKEEFETASSKFEWLNPSSIRDANGRSPGDPLYDKRTLYIPPDALSKMSASQRQYWSIKCQYMDVLIFFKVGKFYELYEIDAEVGQKELDWKMTHTGLGKCRQVGISESGIDDAVQKLIVRGYKVGRMEQMETSEQAKARGANALIQRKLVHVFTPSTATDDNIGPDAVHLLALKEGNWDSENSVTVYGFAFVDCAALKFWVGSVSDDASCAALGTILLQVSPKEVVYEYEGLCQATYKALKKFASTGSNAVQLTSAMPGLDFLDASEVKKVVQSKGYFKGSSEFLTSEFDSQLHQNLALCALGALICHLSRLMMDDALRNGDILPYHVYQNCLRMDGQTLINLEIFNNNLDGHLSGTLYKHLDHCLTSSGKRLLRKWICHPLKSIEEINNRLNAVEGLTKQPDFMAVISEYLRKIPDLERLLGCVKATVSSSATLLVPFVGEKVMKRRVKVFGSLVNGLRIGVDLLRLLQREDHGFSPLLKVLNLPMLSLLDEFLNKFEVAKYQDHHVKDSDAEMLSVHVELFLGKVAEWSQVIHALDCIDVLQAFTVAAMSSTGSMSRPVLSANSHSVVSCQENGGAILKIKGLWHPYAVGENGSGLVPNDIHLCHDSAIHPCALLLTGPNMGGKSTLLRATCLAVILAQLGCYVPCDMCILSPVDVIFTRLGSMDRIMSGESTFLVECMETASVLQHATQDSLVLLDELGRGTSTFDGYAIAYAVFRHLVEKVHCRLLFATHYHSLTKEFASHPRVNLQHMACAFRPKKPLSSGGQEELIFLYRLEAGACPESYGLQVALMAGIPQQVVEAASLASQRMKMSIRENFKSSEGRSLFSTLHEEWLKSLLGVSRVKYECLDEDASDTLLCLWYELNNRNGIDRHIKC